MNHWDGFARWVNAILLAVVGVIGFDTLFRLLQADADNVVVAAVREVASVLLRPFAGMFGPDEYLLTAFVAVLGYALAGGVLLTAIRATQATLRGIARYRRRGQARWLGGRADADGAIASPAIWDGAEAEGFDTGPPGPASALDGRRTDPWEPDEVTRVLGPNRHDGEAAPPAGDVAAPAVDGVDPEVPEGPGDEESEPGERPRRAEGGHPGG